MYAYLTVTLGAGSGTTYLLDPELDNRIGRGTDGTVVVTDPLCSRVHAVIRQSDSRWQIRDAESRNGTFVNGRKVDEATLADGHFIKIGSTEFTFHWTTDPPTVTSSADVDLRQTIIHDRPLEVADSGLLALSAIQDLEQARQLLVLYQLSIKLLGCDQPDEVVRISLDLLLNVAGASVVGFLWLSDEGRLKPKVVLPEGASQSVTLSESLTELVCQQRHAVWVARHTGPTAEAVGHFADALCVPLIHEGAALGAIHVYLERGRFHQTDFDFTISLCNILVVALVRARRQKIVDADYQRLVAESPGYDELVGSSPSMQQLKLRIDRLAQAAGCVLIRGESGSGKELVARALHRASPRSDRPMLSVNCAAIPADLIDSQLFGHKAGSFTSADRDHIGYFEQADSGTLFLDEVGEMTLEGQAKLLRILEGHPFLPVGGTAVVSTDVRVIAATNQDLQALVRERKFREDLYYRLSVFELHVPPLRDRGEDIGRLIDFFVDHFRRKHGRPGLELCDDARARLLSYHWPGNVRQLRNVIDSAVVLADGQTIEIADLGLRDSGPVQLESLRIDFWERRLITEALTRTDRNVPEAAKLLGIGRATLYRKLDEYAIER